MTAPQSPVPIGTVIAGKYRVEKVLGAGAMGVVVAARHLDLHEIRAIKLMLPSALGNAEGVERFFREARAAARLKSQHAAKVHDVGRLDDGAPYTVMEYLEGADLKAVLEQRGALPPAEAVSYVLQACEAIGEAHAAGIVHRDLKPANLFLTRGLNNVPCVKVLDFGIAKLVAEGADAVDMTATSQMLGTPLYMSPEQMRGSRDVGPRADIWSLGVIMYRMLTGQTPFTGSSITEICAAVVADTPAPPRALRPDVPPGLEAVILRCLEKNPAQRFASVAELTAALAPFAQPASNSAAPVNMQTNAGPSSAAPWTAQPAPVSSTWGPQGTGGPQSTGGPHGFQASPGPQYTAAAQPGSAFASAATSGPPYGSPSPYGPPSAPPAYYPPGGPASAGVPPMSNATQSSRGGAGVFVALLLGALVLGGVAAAVVFWRSADDSSEMGFAATPQSQSPSPSGGAMAAPPSSAGAGSTAPSSRGALQPSGAKQASASAPLGTSAAASPSPSATPTPGETPKPVTSSKSEGALRGAAQSCWKNNEGANSGQAASSASISVSAGPPRSVIVTGPAKAQTGFTACTVSRGASMPLEPGEVVQVSVSLSAGPP